MLGIVAIIGGVVLCLNGHAVLGGILIILAVLASS